MRFLATFVLLLALLGACGQDAVVEETPPADTEADAEGVAERPPEAPVDRPARFYYRRAKRALGMGLYEAAIIDAGLALEKDPAHAPSLTLRAMSRILEALDSLHHASLSGDVPDGPLVGAAAAVGLSPEYDRLVRRRLVCDASGDLVARQEGVLGDVVGELEEFLNRAAGAQRDDPAAAGIIAYRRRDFDAARELLADVTRGDAASAAAWNAFGLVRERLGELEEAMAAYRRALEREVPRLEEWLPRGIEPETFRWLPAKAGAGLPVKASAQARGALDAALDDLDRSLEIDAKDPRAFELRGLVHLLQRRPEEARADFELALENAPTRARSWYLLARARHAVASSADDRTAAVRAWRRACDLDHRYLLVFHATSSFERPDLDHVLHELKGMR